VTFPWRWLARASAALLASSSIFQLSHQPGSSSLRSTVVDVRRAERDALGFDPAVRFDGPVDLVGSDLAEDVVAVIREALSNTARHARADAVEVTITASNRLSVRARTTASGSRSAWARVGNGIDNMQARAERHTEAA
jgi:signal transduction histidine kinase